MADEVQFHLLGPVSAGDAPLGTRKERFLLAVLLLEINKLVPAQRLIELLWPETGPANPAGVIHTYVSRLRAALRAAGASVEISRDGAGYLLSGDPAAVDAHIFRDLVEQARRRDDDAEALELLERALALWKGPALGSVTTEQQRAGLARGLDEARIDAAEARFERGLRLGRHREILGELLVAEAGHPHRQRLTRQLMLALHRCGRTGEAMDAYRAARERLVREAGLSPAAELEETALAILRDEPEPLWRGPRGSLRRLVGREQELRSLATLLREHRMVTVSGAGGCGKTTLALRVAEDLRGLSPHGVIVVDIAALTSSDQLVAACATLAGTRPERLAQTLAHEAPLLVLDNCEHLAEACASLCAELLAACPRLTVLATSRQPLDVPGEAVLRLAPLGPGPAAALFAARAAAACPGLRLGDRDVAEVCRLLDGIPLAIELAAAKLRVLPIGALAERLKSGMELLEWTTPWRHPRHHTLTATINWSYRLLDVREQRLLARLSEFAGGFGLQDAEAVCGFAPLTSEEVAPLVGRLVDRSLVHPYDEAGRRRFRLHHTIHVVAAGKLGHERTELAHSHLDRWLRLAADVDALPYHERRERLLALDPDLPNLRRVLVHACDHGRGGDAATVTARMFGLWSGRVGRLAEGERLLPRMFAHAASRETAALLGFHQVVLASTRGETAAVVELAPPVIGELAGLRPREHLMARTTLLTNRRMLIHPSAPAEAAELVASLPRGPGVALGGEVRTALTAAGWVLASWGRYGEAAALCDRYDEIPGGPVAAAQLCLRAEIALRPADLDRARALAGELAERLAGLHNPAEQELPRRMITSVRLAMGEPDKAAEVAELPRGTPAAVPYLKALQAEALRQCGRTGAALEALADGLDRPAGHAQLLALPCVLEAALLARTLGDESACDRLLAGWQEVRRRAGLPAPTGLHLAAEQVLGVVPGAPGPPAAGDPVPVEDLIEQASGARAVDPSREFPLFQARVQGVGERAGVA